MSVDALSWAFRLDLPPTEKLLLLHYADRAGEEHECFPSFRDAVERTGLSERAVIRSTEALEAKGLLARQGRDAANGSHRSNRYTLHVGEPGTTTLRPVKRARRMAPLLTQSQNPSDSGSPPLLTQSQKHFVEPSLSEPPREPSLKEKDISLTTVRSVSRADCDPDFDEFWSVYPRKVAKDRALKAWKAARKKATAAQIVEGVKTYPFSEDPQFQPHPATWLNGGNWEGETHTQPLTTVVRTPPPMSGRNQAIVNLREKLSRAMAGDAQAADSLFSGMGSIGHAD